MGDLIRDSFVLALRRPLFVLIVPIVVTVASTLLSVVLLDRRHPIWMVEDHWIRPDTVLATLLLGLTWVGVAWEPDKRRSRAEQRRRLGVGAVAGVLLGFAFMVATELTFVGGVVVMGLLPTLVPVVVAEAGGLGRGLSRAFSLGKGSRGRILLAWGLLELIVSAVGMLGAFALWAGSYVLDDDTAVVLAFRANAGLRWGLTMALSVAAYRRLRVSRSALDVDEWVEVFE